MFDNRKSMFTRLNNRKARKVIAVPVTEIEAAKEYVHDLECRVDALQKENTHLSLLGVRRIN